MRVILDFNIGEILYKITGDFRRKFEFNLDVLPNMGDSFQIGDFINREYLMSFGVNEDESDSIINEIENIEGFFAVTIKDWSMDNKGIYCYILIDIDR